jgi:diguanylate cyclase (GGDEF)-like protein
VLFNPIEVRFAAPLDAEPRVLAAIDRRLAELKADSGSIYYRSLDRWLGGGTTGISQRVALLTLLGAGVLVLGFVLLSVLLRVQVRQRTAELQAQSGDLRREIDERRKAEERLNELAYFDTLTGLPNRALLLDRLGQALEHARRNQTLVAVLFFDIDDFKKVNDSLGHAFGDQLLQEFSERIGERIREADTLSRLGGDEFTLVLTDIERADDAAAVAIDLLETLTPPFLIEGHEIMAPVSIGITMFPNDGDNVDELLKHADTAMYQAKGQGKRQYRFYSPELTARVHERLSLEGALRQALRLGRLELHYQPQISLAQPGLVAVEALLRWRGEDGRMIPPAEFIPVAEDSGLIGPVGAWVMERACQDLKHWEEAGVEVPRVAINLSSRQLETGRLSSLIAKVLSRTGVAGERLELEITESVFVEQTRENIAILTSLQDLGCRIAVDDFGTGYASFNYLQRLPLQCVKIDRSFIAEIDDSGRTRRLVAAMAAMAEALDISIVAEGVETQSQLAYVRAHGYGAAQGYLIARAMSAEALEQWLREPSHLAAS